MTTASPPATASAAEAFFDALARADERSAVDLAVGLLDAGVPVEEVLLQLVGRAQERVGLLWQTGDWSVAQEHAATCINERVVAAVGSRVRTTGDRGHIVLACLDGEWHALPARIVAEVLRQHGWRVTFLGASVPPAHLISYLHEHGPDVVAVSCALPIHLPAAHQVIAAAQRTGTPVLAGGPGFGAEGKWAVRLGVDGWAPSATDAVALLESGSWPGRVAEGRPADGGAEYAGLHARRPALVRAGLDRLQGVSPLAGEHDNPLDGQAHEDVGRIVDFLAAAVYLRDRDLFPEYAGWLGGVLAARAGSAAGVEAVLDAIADELLDFPVAQDYLRCGRTALVDAGREQ